MKSLSYVPQKLILSFFLALFSFLFITSGCSVKKAYQQVQVLENLGVITGKISSISNQKGAIMVVLFRDEGGIPVRESRENISEKGIYHFNVIPGSFYIAAFVDINRDGLYQPEEHGNYYGYPTNFAVAAQQTIALETITISGQPPKLDAKIKPINKEWAVWKNIGKVITLDDHRLTHDNYTMGLWKPLEFLETAEGGLFFLHEYEKDKTPVLFIHGVMGGPTNWENVIEALDKQRFQPWVLYYPSGLRLDMISDYLVEAVTRLQNKHGFEKINVIAHSMGGLVTRSFIKKYVEYAPENLKRLGLVMTVNSPMEGMSSASSGVKHSPIVVPSWRDVEPGSEFLKGINTWNWPRGIPYHLIVSYKTGKSGDGVVALQSQVPMKLQLESSRMYIFNDDHVGTLNNENFHRLFNRILKDNFEK